MVKTGLCLTSSSGEHRNDGFVAKGDDVGGDTTLCRGERHDPVPKRLGKGLRKPLRNTVRTVLHQYES
jgi:hypothetical protein